jgi:hypothetical protein
VVSNIPNYGTAWMMKGWALYTTGALDSAVECFEAASRLGHPQARRALELCRVTDARHA